jgi:myo-inositol-1(or 4)-monophosphatase
MSDVNLSEVVSAVQAAAQVLVSRYSPNSRPDTAEALIAALSSNDEASLAVLKPALQKVRPEAGWVEDEDDDSPLPPGEWWLTDPVEGNINHVHGLPNWGVTATLVRDGVPVLTVVHLPLAGLTYSAERGAGAFLNGSRLKVSTKTELRAALVSTAQSKPGESAETQSRMGHSVIALLRATLLVGVSVPSSLQLIEVAAGRIDAFWQHARGGSALAGGALLVREAGGTVTDLHGRPWRLDSEDFLASAPGLSAELLNLLAPPI